MVLKKLKNVVIWIVISILLLYAAIALFLININFARSEIENFLSKRLTTNLKIQHIKGGLSFINPHITLNQIVIQGSDTTTQKIDRLKIKFNLASLLFRQTPLIKSVNIDHATFNVITGNNNLASSEVKNLHESIKQTIDKIFFVQHFDLNNIDIHLHNNKTATDKDIKVKRLISWQKANSISLQSDLMLDRSAITLHGNISPDKNTQEQIVGIFNVNTHSFVLTPAWIQSVFPPEITQFSAHDFSSVSKIVFNKTRQNWALFNTFNLPKTDIAVNQHIISTRHMKGKIDVHGNNFQQWSAQVNVDKFTVNQVEYPDSTISVAQTTDDKKTKLQITVPETKISIIKNILLSSNLLPEKYQSVLKTLNPAGNLSKTVISLYPQQKHIDFTANTEFHDISVDAWKGAPSGKNISGHMTMNSHEGTININSKNVALGLQNVFSDAWHYDTVKGKLHWKITSDVYTLFTPEMITTTSTQAVAGHGNNAVSTGQINLQLDIPLKKETPVVMKLNAHVDKFDTHSAKQYLPTSVLSPSLSQWIKNNITSGTISDTTFSWDGPLANIKPENLKWGLNFNIDKTTINYSDDWPEITSANATVNIDQQHFNITNASGTIYNSKVSNINATIDNFVHPVLLLSAQSQISGKDTLAIFQNSLLNKKLKGAPQKWKIEGLFDTKLSLTLPLQDSHDSSLTNIEINTAIINSQFSLPQQPAITNVNGMIHYSSKTGFKAKNIQGELLNHPVNISVKNEMLQGKNRITYILCKGQADFNRLKPFIPDNLSKFIEGDMNYEVRLGIPESGDYFIDLKSNLKGLTIDMPDKFKKSKEQEQPFYLLLTPFEHNKLNLYIEYGKLLYTTLGIRNKQIAFGSVILNPNKNSATDAVFKKGITFSGVIDEVNLNNWIEWLKKYQLLTTSTPVHLPLLAKKLVINSIKFKDYTLGKINLNSEIKNDKIISSFDSREIKGFVVQSEDHKDQPLSIVLKELNLPDNTLQKYTQLSLQKNQINHINPSIFPALQLSVEQIHIGDQYYGKVKFNLEPQAHTIILRQLNALLGNLQIDGTLTWENIGKSQQTSTFEGKLETENLNTMFKKWHYSQTNFHAKFAKVITHLTWSGTPFDFNLVQSTGEVSALVRNGNITGTSDIDKLHIFGLLNINTITKRLRLDFSDLFDSGISFDKIKGSASFKEGLITLNAPVIIDGPSSNFALYGTINIPKKYVDLNMDVSLPIAQNLPTISLLLGQPALAGAIYLFDKLVGKKIMKFSTLRYNIKGQVDNPVVTADKSFADQFKKVKNTATINKNKTTH